MIVLGETFTATIAAGYALILAGCLLATARNRRGSAGRAHVSRTAEPAAELA